MLELRDISVGQESTNVSGGSSMRATDYDTTGNAIASVTVGMGSDTGSMADPAEHVPVAQDSAATAVPTREELRAMRMRVYGRSSTE